MTFRERIHRVEAALIRRALRDANGSVTKAARILGFKRHQSLSAMLSKRHKNLRMLPKVIRHKPLMTVPAPPRKPRHFGRWDRPGL